MNVKLDFSKLFTENEEEPTEEQKKPDIAVSERQTGLYSVSSMAEERENIRAELTKVYRQYQNHIKQSAENRKAILLSLRAGDRDYKKLFLLAVDTVSSLTNDNGFYRAVVDYTQESQRAEQKPGNTPF